MSVSPTLGSLPTVRVPARLNHLVPGARGKDGDRIFRIGAGPFKPGPITGTVELFVDHATHGVIQPSSKMPLTEFEIALASTRESWRIAEGA